MDDATRTLREQSEYKRFEAGFWAGRADYRNVLEAWHAHLGIDPPTLAQYRAYYAARADEMMGRGAAPVAPADARLVTELQSARDAFGDDWRDDLSLAANIEDELQMAAADERTISLLVAEGDALRRCLSFFASVIKSGEGWSETCQWEYDAAPRSRAAAQVHLTTSHDLTHIAVEPWEPGTYIVTIDGRPIGPEVTWQAGKTVKDWLRNGALNELLRHPCHSDARTTRQGEGT